jgi:Na+/H+-dicarboxylate symporter
MRAPILQYLRPLGDFYVALLQMCVLPFLLTTIPLAVRSAMVSGTAAHVARWLLFWALADCFSLLVPIGIVALIAPQIALMGPEIYAVLAMFSYAFVGVCLVVLLGALVVLSVALRVSPRSVFASMLKPMMLGASTRNTLVCVPLAIEVMKSELGAASAPCELFIPVGFATLRFGTILYFVIATLFMGTLLGRSFGASDLLLVAVLSTAASFATLGVSGLAALAPLAAVLRPFGLSYELAVPMMIIIDPIANMVRVMVNIAVNCTIPALAGGRDTQVAALSEARAPA